MDAYRTVADRGESAFEVRGSRFLGVIERAERVADAESFLEAMRAEYADATHVVPAYRVRLDGFLREYRNDDGEPSGSAGEPVVNVLVGEELENVVVAVVRYYGGTNLGVGGLVSAYGDATKGAIEDAGVVTERPQETFLVTVEYDDSGTVRSVLESADVAFEAEYVEKARFEVRVPSEDADGLRERLRNATGGRVEISDDE